LDLKLALVQISVLAVILRRYVMKQFQVLVLVSQRGLMVNLILMPHALSQQRQRLAIMMRLMKPSIMMQREHLILAVTQHYLAALDILKPMVNP